MDASSKKVKYLIYRSGRFFSNNGNIITETPVSLFVNGAEWLTFMCTPTELTLLGIGFLYNERIIQSIDEVKSVQVCDSGRMIDVWLNHNVDIPNKWRKTSGCTGGTTSITTESSNHFRSPQNKVQFITTEQLLQVVEQLLDAQVLYRKAGGVHTTILTNVEKVIFASEDIGRHNTLDKIAGFILQENLIDVNGIIATTGRISSEMLQKSARINAQIVISRTSPSTSSVTMAKKLGITLIGYARRNQFIVYTHSNKIIKH